MLLSSTSEDDKNRQLRYYTEGGVREYWIIDAEARTVAVRNLRDQTLTVYNIGMTVKSTLPELAGLSVDVTMLFDNLIEE